MKRKLLVIDTSVMVKWANSQNENDLNQAYKVLINAEKKKVELLAPELAKYEIGNALLNKKMLLPETKLSLQTIYSLPIIFIPTNQESATETMEIAKENSITYYDAAFVQLAREKNATLVSANPKHHRQFKDIRVIDLKNYR